MATNTGFLMIAGLGALLLLGRGGATETADEDNRLAARQGRGGPMPPAFNLQSYIDGLFGEMATVPVQQPMKFFYPRPVVVTSSGVPSVSSVAPELITPTTKVAIGGDGGETITASAQAVLRSEQITRQEFEYSANVFGPAPGETAEANRIEEERQKQFARDRIAKNIADQLERNRAVVARTRAEQERLADPFSLAGQPIIVLGEQDVFASEDEQSSYAPGPQYSETFVISGGMDSPAFLGEEEDYQPTMVHELSASYDIGF